MPNANRRPNWFKRNPKCTRVLKKFVVPIAITGAIVGSAVAAVPLALGAVGFGSAGVVAGSMAATAQAAIGNVAAGSLFAACQSIGAAGLATSTVVGSAAAGGVVGAVGGAASLVLDEHEEQNDPAPPQPSDDCGVCGEVLKVPLIALRCGHIIHWKCHKGLEASNGCPKC